MVLTHCEYFVIKEMTVQWLHLQRRGRLEPALGGELSQQYAKRFMPPPGGGEHVFTLDIKSLV